MLFGKLKHWLRTAAGCSSDAICNAISAILAEISPDECLNFITRAWRT
jgi:hypothetical protein